MDCANCVARIDHDNCSDYPNGQAIIRFAPQGKVTIEAPARTPVAGAEASRIRYVCENRTEDDWTEDDCAESEPLSQVEQYWNEETQQWQVSDGADHEIWCSSCSGPMRQEIVVKPEPGADVSAQLAAEEKPC